MFDVLKRSLEASSQTEIDAIRWLTNEAYRGEELSPPEWLKLHQLLNDQTARFLDGEMTRAARLEKRQSRKGQSRESRDREG